MKRNPRFGAQPGERVRVKAVFGGYPLKEGLKDGDVVLLKSWTGAYYMAEFQGREFSLDQVNIIAPVVRSDA